MVVPILSTAGLLSAVGGGEPLGPTGLSCLVAPPWTTNLLPGDGVVSPPDPINPGVCPKRGEDPCKFVGATIGRLGVACTAAGSFAAATDDEEDCISEMGTVLVISRSPGPSSLAPLRSRSAHRA